MDYTNLKKTVPTKQQYDEAMDFYKSLEGQEPTILDVYSLGVVIGPPIDVIGVRIKKGPTRYHDIWKLRVENEEGDEVTLEIMGEGRETIERIDYEGEEYFWFRVTPPNQTPFKYLMYFAGLRIFKLEQQKLKENIINNWTTLNFATTHKTQIKHKWKNTKQNGFLFDITLEKSDFILKTKNKRKD